MRHAEIFIPLHFHVLHCFEPPMEVTNFLLTRSDMRYRMSPAHTNCSRRSYPTEPILSGPNRTTTRRFSCTNNTPDHSGGLRVLSLFDRVGMMTDHAEHCAIMLSSRWREIRACNGNVCGESKSQNSHESLLDLTFLIAATAPKAPIYCYLISRQRLSICQPLGLHVLSAQPRFLIISQGEAYEQSL
jgi:hypothetical protein